MPGYLGNTDIWDYRYDTPRSDSGQHGARAALYHRSVIDDNKVWDSNNAAYRAELPAGHSFAWKDEEGFANTQPTTSTGMSYG